MQYDIHGSWEERRTGYLAPLYNTPGEADPQNVIATTTQDWIDAGCPRDKLILGRWRRGAVNQAVAMIHMATIVGYYYELWENSQFTSNND